MTDLIEKKARVAATKSLDLDSGDVSDDDSDCDSITDEATGTSGEEKIRFTPEMTRKVFRLRLLVFLVLFMAAIAVSFVVYYVTKGGETEGFESSYQGTASKVMAVFEGIVTEKLDAVASLSIAATAHSSDQMTGWPLFSLSYFQERAMAARKQSGTLFTSLVPMVTNEEREAWENYTVDDPEGWIEEGLEVQKQWDAMTLGVSLPSWSGEVHPGYIMYDDWEAGMVRDDGYGPYFPLWQTSPLLKGLVNFNLASLPQWYDEILTCLQKRVVVIGRTLTPAPGNALQGSYLTRFFATILSIKYGKRVDYEGDPFSYVFFPVFDTFIDETKEAVAVMFTAINWRVYFENLLPDNIVGVTLVLSNGCDDPFTYTINGQEVVFNGQGDLHDKNFDDMKRTTSFASLANKTSVSTTSLERNNFVFDSTQCPYSISVYPSEAFYDMHTTDTPAVITSAVAGIFVFTVLLFVAFDRVVECRQRILLKKATQTTEILSSIYPANIRDKLLAEHGIGGDSKKSENSEFLAPNHRLKSFLNNSDKDPNSTNNLQACMQPLADLFPNTTVLFADIAGFTAWSSVRDPAQVFILLQTLYGAFDSLAKSRKVFKIETIGDCYVAVTGLPKPQETHAVIMARFASDCLHRMGQLTKQLQVTLGPGTDELGIRIGLHSGPVTAGVLRGDRARFQLFGDTVNTAARMESTGVRNRIQVSEKTAGLLTAAGKGHWVKPREDSVNAKGKGVLNTHWVYVKKRSSSVASRSSLPSTSNSTSDQMEDISISSDVAGEHALKPKTEKPNKKNEKHDRLVDWVVEIIIQYLQEIVALREARTKKGEKVEKKDFQFFKQGTNLDEVVEVIALPKFDQSSASSKNYHSVAIDVTVVRQIRKLVDEISKTYRDNPFHNFEHACHVTMSVHKLLSRIVAPDLEVEEIEKAEKNAKEFASHLHDYTHGINSDPLTRCAIIFSALIHDSDHRGVSNAQLGKEDEAMAALYHNKSLAEQNSLDLCWQIFMGPDYIDFRNCLLDNEAEFARFRQVCVNVVLATDIFDQELNDLRKKRWEKAFSTEKSDDKETAKPTGNSGLRATIVIEHIIQASDVSHTMQHWHVYRKYNRLLFKEMQKAYKAGRMGADPSAFWYKGEIGFFDNYIIPLAKKLKDCGVFGVSSDECLDYALQNRNEWEVRGVEIVQELIAEIKEEERANAPHEAEA